MKNADTDSAHVLAALTLRYSFYVVAAYDDAHGQPDGIPPEYSFVGTLRADGKRVRLTRPTPQAMALAALGLEPLRACKQCGQGKPIEEYALSRNRNGDQVRLGRCKACERIRCTLAMRKGRAKRMQSQALHSQKMQESGTACNAV